MVTLSGKDICLGVHDTDKCRAMYRRMIAEWLENQQQPPASSCTGTQPETEAAHINGLFVAYFPKPNS